MVTLSAGDTVGGDTNSPGDGDTPMVTPIDGDTRWHPLMVTH